MIGSLAIEATVTGARLPLGEPVSLRVDGADPAARQVHLTPV